VIAIDEVTWERLTPPTGERLIARQPLPDVTNRLLCALDSMGNRHLLLMLDQEDVQFSDKKSRGLHIATRNLLVQGQKASNFIDIECLDVAGFAILNIIGGEIAVELTEDNDPIDIVTKVLTKWRRFWGQLPLHVLTKEKQLGLFAEIFFLSRWLIPMMGPTAINAWHGPWGSRHDFEWVDKSVEVKATTNSRGHIHRIHGVEQLSAPEKGPLYLFSLCLREESGGTNNLPGLIEECRKKLENPVEFVNTYYNALIQIGYSNVHQDEYAKLNFRVAEALVYIVDKDFPRLTLSTFPTGMPLGIEYLEYEINLNSFTSLVVAHTPNDLFIDN
jgi:hypothetical protein